jgi:tetratricopeptide (TPR) repeat protein
MNRKRSRLWAIWPAAGMALLLLGTAAPVALAEPADAGGGVVGPLKDFATIAAVLISLVALIATQRSTRAKTLREQRDELKESIEKLIDIRREFNATMPTLGNDAERLAYSSMMNTKKSIYLESSERLALGLPFVTPAEWMVLGFEHMYDANFHHAEQLFERAVRSARTSSTVTQVSAMRSLAGAQMAGLPDSASARKTFRKALSLLAERTDAYSQYAAALTYRTWAESEFSRGEGKECHDRLRDALRVVAVMPDFSEFKSFEARACVADLLTLAADFEKRNLIDASREALADAAAAIQPFADDVSKESAARVAARSAWLEFAQGDPGNAAHAIWAARAAIDALPPNSPMRMIQLPGPIAGGDGLASGGIHR